MLWGGPPDDNPAFLLVLIAALVLLLAGAPAQAQVSAPDTPTAPLTAEISDEPESHNGTDAFTFRVAFSENVAVSLAEFRDHTLKTTNGSIIGARRIGGTRRPVGDSGPAGTRTPT